MDFTLPPLGALLKSLINASYQFQTLSEHLKTIPPNNNRPFLLIRHDVDKLPKNSLQFAQIQHDLGIKATYYFRIVPESFNEKIIKQIADLGHEIGYHYEDMDLAWRAKDDRPLTIDDSGEGLKEDDSPNDSTNQPSSIVHRPSSLSPGPSSLHQKAIKSFENNLAKLREIAPITTICMHGSPRSPFDNKELWKYYDYRNYGIIGEPYFDIDFTKVAYYTDTGRMWDGDKYSVRDRVEKGPLTMDDGLWTEESKPEKSPKLNATSQPAPISYRGHHIQPRLPVGDITASPDFLSGASPFPTFHSTSEIITSLRTQTFPPQAMLTFHPQRWTNNPALWTKELVMQSAKNVVKRYFFVKK